MQTPLTEKPDAEMGSEVPRGRILGRKARPEEIAKLIQFLLSEDSSYTPSSVYQVDGGNAVLSVACRISAKWKEEILQFHICACQMQRSNAEL